MPNNNSSLTPVVKWVGGKRQLLSDIVELLPKELLEEKLMYYEPFIGGGALFFHLKPSKAIINDNNSELINLYKVIKQNPSELIEDLKRHKNEENYFYEIRAIDRDEIAYSKLSDVEKASRLLYLNKTCYNGLYRVNSLGQFNTPFGKYNKPNIVNEKLINEIHNYLSISDIKITNKDFEMSLNNIEADSFVYFDPPYDPLSSSSNFTAYTKDGFSKQEQIRLRDLCIRLDRMGVKFLISNSDTDFICELYSCFNITKTFASRAVNSKAAGRGTVSEVLVTNY
ncbi:MAG: DNA adenine methylase [Spirochaetales bacterium]|nr:DNA adenine methylase [Spirochaetales bacterium]